MDNRINEAYHTTSRALKHIYKKRKRTLRYQKIVWSIAGVFFLWMIFQLFIPNAGYFHLEFFKVLQPSASNPYASLNPIIGLMVLLYPANYAFAKAFQNYITLEHKTIAQMVQKLFPAAAFTQGITPPRNEVKASKLFPGMRESTQLYAYGLLRQKFNENTIHITDIGLVEPKATNAIREGLARIPLLNMGVVLYQYVFKNIFTSQTADTVQFTFRGMFAWMSFKKSLNGHTLILTNNQSTNINRYFSSRFMEEQRVRLEDPRFTDQFTVYSTDQVEALYVLSSAIMERIVDLKEKFNQPILLSFQNKQMFLAVENKNGLFSFPNSSLDIQIVEALESDIHSALTIGKRF